MSLISGTNFLVFDIETVPDLQMVNDLNSKEDIEKLQNGDFLHFPLHRIISISCMIVKERKVKNFFALTSDEEDKVVKSFWDCFVDSCITTDNNISYPVIITVNGKDFDVPVILSRTLKYVRSFEDSVKNHIEFFLNKEDKWEKERPNYTSKYSKYHIDIAEDLCGKKISLKKLAYLCGIPVKQEGEGDKVESYYAQRQFDRIARYCAEDVKATALLFAYINEHLKSRQYDFPSFSDIESQTPVIRVV